MPTKRYTPEERARAVLLAHELGSAEAAGRKLGIPGPTVRRWASGARASDTLGLVREAKKAVVERLTESMMELRDALMGDLRGGKLSAGQKITAFGVMADKVIMLRRTDTRKDEGTPELERIAAALERDALPSGPDHLVN